MLPLKFNTLGTQTGRFSSSEPNMGYGYSKVPLSSFGTKWETTPPLSSELKTILNIDYRKLEQRAWALSHNYSFDFAYVQNFDFAYVQKICPYTVDPVKSKDIYVLGKPIELNQLESFRVEICMPQRSVDVRLLKTKIQDLLGPKCSCKMQILMRVGCQCGGA